MGEIKKGKHVYYHCIGQRGKCPEKGYARDDEIELQFTEVVRQITLLPILVGRSAAALPE